MAAALRVPQPTSFSTEGRAGQSGQAIVLIAIMLTVLVGMTALAIDGSRAYALKRDLQAAVDSAALAAADKLQQSGSYATAEQAATNVFASNLRLYSSPSCSPSYGSPGAAPWTVTCTYPDGTALTQVVRAVGPQGSQFAMSATRSLQLQFARVLSSGPSPVLASSATGNVNNLLYTPTIAALNQAGCGGAAGTAISLSGSGTLNVNGDVVSNGSITVSSGALRVAGDAYARCQSSVAGGSTACYPSAASSPCSYPDVLGVTRSGFRLADPNYPSPAVVGSSQSRPGSTVGLSPGTYAVNPNLTANVCYFLNGGVYAWQAGYANSGGGALVSNELKPPDEPTVANNQVASAYQFWNSGGVNCAGSFMLAAKGVGGVDAIRTGTWAIEITSVRTDTYNGMTYTRESAPSMCRTVSIAVGQAIQIQMSNLPGAASYNVYAAPPTNGCAGPFGLAGSIAVNGPVRNNDLTGCPFGSGANNGHGNGNGNNGDNCSLGGEDAIFDATLLGLVFAPICWHSLAWSAPTLPTRKPGPSTPAFRTRIRPVERALPAIARTRTTASRRRASTSPAPGLSLREPSSSTSRLEDASATRTAPTRMCSVGTSTTGLRCSSRPPTRAPTRWERPATPHTSASSTSRRPPPALPPLTRSSQRGRAG